MVAITPPSWQSLILRRDFHPDFRTRRRDPCRPSISSVPNWARFLSTLSDERIAEAELSLQRWLGDNRFDGLSFLDIGIGLAFSVWPRADRGDRDVVRLRPAIAGLH
ncbi:MAG: hypothetical protein U5K74_01480 [Gemmatimonadaceae bacterium]|nr:hypothetical protein [Gemmatimonadaceae bacterium]